MWNYINQNIDQQIFENVIPLEIVYVCEIGFSAFTVIKIIHRSKVKYVEKEKRIAIFKL